MKSISLVSWRKNVKSRYTLKQIEEKESVFVLENAGIEDILKIGAAFLGKDVEIESERRIGNCERWK